MYTKLKLFQSDLFLRRFFPKIHLHILGFHFLLQIHLFLIGDDLFILCITSQCTMLLD